jgi:hypothetical protein
MALAFQRPQKLVRLDARVFHPDTNFAEHRFAEQAELNDLLGERIRVRSCHERHEVLTVLLQVLFPGQKHPFYNMDRHFQATKRREPLRRDRLPGKLRKLGGVGHPDAPVHLGIRRTNL